MANPAASFAYVGQIYLDAMGQLRTGAHAHRPDLPGHERELTSTYAVDSEPPLAPGLRPAPTRRPPRLPAE